MNYLSLKAMRSVAYALRHISIRQWRKNWMRTVILVGIIGVGLGGYYAIRLANNAAIMGFEWFSDSVSGESPLIIFPPSGLLSVDNLPKFRERSGSLPAHFFPVLESTAIDKSYVGEGRDAFEAPQFQLLGMDLISLANLAYINPQERYISPAFGQEGATIGNKVKENSTPDLEVFIPEALSLEKNWNRNDYAEVIINDKDALLRIRGILPANEYLPSPPKNLILTDLPDLQAFLGLEDQINRVEVQIPKSVNQDIYNKTIKKIVDALSPEEGDNWILMNQSDKQKSASSMTAGFRMNLSILSLLGLIVGGYLIFQSLEASVSLRRSEIATLKSLGFSTHLIQTIWIIEAVVLGILGSISGLIFGYLGAQSIVGGISKTVNSLYYSNSVEAASWDWTEALIAFVLGVSVSLIAGWLPSRHISKTPPAHALGKSQLTSLLPGKSFLMIGLTLLIVGIYAATLSPINLIGFRPIPVWGYITALIWIVAFGLITVLFLSFVAQSPLFKSSNSLSIKLALSHLRRPTFHHFWAVAGLVASAGMAAAMAILIASFESTILQWMNTLLKADVFIASPGISNASSENRISKTTWKTITEREEVKNFELGYFDKVLLNNDKVFITGTHRSLFNSDASTIWIKEPSSENKRKFDLTSGGEEVSDQTLPCLITETLAYHQELKMGDIVTIPTPRKKIEFFVAGIYADYGSEFGSVTIPQDVYIDSFGDENIINMALSLKQGENLDDFVASLKSNHPNLVIRSNREIRYEALKIFKQTFSVTYALQIIGVVVAITGLALSLTSLWVNRSLTLKTWKELGISKGMTSKIIIIEGFIITFIGAIGGIALSLLLGWLLVFVINKQSFGWTLDYYVPNLQIGFLFVLLLFSGVGVTYIVSKLTTKNLKTSVREI